MRTGREGGKNEEREGGEKSGKDEGRGKKEEIEKACIHRMYNFYGEIFHHLGEYMYQYCNLTEPNNIHNDKTFSKQQGDGLPETGSPSEQHSRKVYLSHLDSTPAPLHPATSFPKGPAHCSTHFPGDPHNSAPLTVMVSQENRLSRKR